MERTNTAGNQRIAELFDAGTFSEIGAYVKRPGDAGCYEGVICGYGAIAGKLAFAFVEDSGRDKGAFDATAAEKINRLYDMAVASGAPVIGVFDSAGARIEDGSAVLSAYAGFLHAVSGASGRVPQIALIGGVCSGLSATAASMFDLRIGVAEKSQFYTVPGRKKSAQALYEGGTFAALCKDDAEAYAFVRRLIDWLPQNSRGEQATDDTANMQAEVAGLSGQSLLDAIADNGASIPLYGGIGKEILTELVRVGGRLVGAIVSDPSVDSGKLTGAGAKKAESLVSFCNSFRIPVLTLVDCAGFSADSACAATFGRLADTYAKADVPKVAVVTGQAYGGSAALLASRALGADVVFALQGAKIAPMAPDAAVAFLWNDRISDTVSRESLEAEWANTYASAEKAAEKGDVDDLIPTDELRARLTAALYMLTDKTAGAPAAR